MAETSEVLIEERGRAGLLTLNRPEALNALTLDMVRAIRAALDRWAGDPGIAAIIVRGAGGRAFCAGGDILSIYHLGKAGRAQESLGFWAEEYDLNRVIKRYPKPYVALIDGIVMGGGVGVSLHGSHRVAGERFQFAMPEVGIGFFPDVGATYALPRLPWFSGYWLALTGARIGRGAAAALGIVTHSVEAARFDALVDAVAAGEPPHAALARETVAAGDASELAQTRLMVECFAGETVEAVLAALDAAGAKGSDFAAQAATAMRAKSPTSLKIAHAALRRGRALEFEDAMKLEFRVCSRIVDGHDLYEGIRAQVIDKDRKPRWAPDTLAGVTAEAIEPYFADLWNRELVFREARA